MRVNVLPADPVDRIRIFDSRELPADAQALEQLDKGTRDLDLVAPPVVLPDFHHKRKLEMPSSVAVATANTIRPTLTSSSVNCGMALIALDGARPDDAAMTQFFQAVRERFPYPKGNRRDLTRREVVAAATEGAAFAQDRWGAHDEDLSRIEEGGRLDLEPYGGARRLTKEIPSLAFQLARIRFGSIGPSNHFVELQTVEEVLDPEAAELLGVREGQLTLQFHAGGGPLASIVGRMFGRRLNYPQYLRAVNTVLKPWAHLRPGSPEQLRQRLALYFGTGCPPVPRQSTEGERLMLANAAAMNYGFAFRLATYSFLRQLAVETFGGTPGRLVVDSPHNSIYEEDVDGVSALVHRHNSCRAFPADRMPAESVFSRTGQAVLVPGTHRTSSYLCVAGAQSARTLHSACHGAGTVVSQYAESGRSTSDPGGRSTLRFRYSDAAPEHAAHLDDRGVDAALGILTRAEIVRPVARMRPIGVLH